jgi:hypothetical protein
MRRYKVTVKLTKSNRTVTKELEVSGENVYSILMELGFLFGKNSNVKGIKFLSVEDLTVEQTEQVKG